MPFCFLFQIDPIIQEGNEGIVHHMLLYECSDDFPRSNLSYQGTIFSPDMPPAVRECAGPSVITAWAIGGQVSVVTKCDIFNLTIELCITMNIWCCFFCHLEKKENKSDWVRTWANGNHLLDSQSFYYPEQVGFSIGEHDSPKIVVLEVHYDNYELKAGNFCMLSCTGAVFFFSPAKQLDNFIAFRPPSWRGLWRENESNLILLLGLLNFPLAESNIAFN